ncbi:MAG TPA: VWA domain-containing protein, partial [Cellulomonas sp.]
AAVWWWSRRRRRRDAVRVASLVVLRSAVPARSAWRHRVPTALLVAALAVLGVAAARPQAAVAVPENGTTIVLTLDMSASMCSTDVSPNRLTAAQAAATAFVKSQSGGTRIGLVAFSASATQLVAPTTDTGKLVGAIGTLKVSRGTAIGMGILTAIDSIASVDPGVAPTGGTPPATPVQQPDVIVVLTDGANTQGVDPVTAAQEAAARGLRVYTIGFGTDTPGPSACTADQLQAGAVGGFGRGGGYAGNGGGYNGGYGGGRGGAGALELDEQTLSSVASTTGGAYVRAQDARQLTAVLNGLPSSLVVVHEEEELTAWFVAVAAVLVLAALGLAAAWSGGLSRRRPRRSPAGVVRA